MFAFSPRKELILRIALIAVILFNAFASNAQPAQAKQEAGSAIGSQLKKTQQESHSIQPFDRPVPRVWEGNSDGVVESFQTNITTETNADSHIMFIENVGQFDPRAHFQVQGSSSTMFFSDSTIWITVIELSNEARNLRFSHDLDDTSESIPNAGKGVNIKISFPGTNPKPRIEPFNRLDTKVFFLKGSNSLNWHTDVPVWGGVRYVDLFPGTDLEITSENGSMVWTIVLRDETRFHQSMVMEKQGLRVKIQGGNKLTYTNNGLNLLTEIGNLVFPTFQLIGFSPNAKGHTIVNNEELLLIPPTTTSADEDYNFPTSLPSNGYFHFTALSSQINDAMNLSLTQDIPFETNLSLAKVFGGTASSDFPEDIIIGNDGSVYIAGDTYSFDFPTTADAFDTTFNSVSSKADVFFAKMDSSGNILYSTFLGGSQADFVEGMAIAEDNSIYLAGWTTSPNFPATSDAYDNVYNGTGSGVSSEGFITQINLDLETNPVYSSYFDYPSYLGGNIHNSIFDIFLDTNQKLVLNVEGSDGGTGHTHYFLRFNKETEEVDFAIPIPGYTSGRIREMEYALDSMYFTGYFNADIEFNCDAFAGKATSLGIEYITIIREGDCLESDASGDAIDIDQNGNVYAISRSDVYAANTKSVFITKLDAAGTIVNDVFLGTVERVSNIDLKVDYDGGIYVAGSLDSDSVLDMVNLGTVQGRDDVFVLRLSQTSSPEYYRLTSGFLIGGDEEEGVSVIDVDQNGNVYLAGSTNSTTFEGISRSNNTWDAFLLVISSWPPVPTLSTTSPGTSDCNAYSGALGLIAGPINTRTGGYDYSISDISIPTSAGNLTFQREYTSLSIDNPTSLSPGWTHNHDSRLIFPEDPGGLEDRILFKAHTANQYIFTINGDGTYSAYPGLCSTLVNEQGTYIVKDSGQSTYTFDSTGVLQSFADSEGHAWDYSYTNGKLELIEANGGSVYLDLEYDAQGRIESVSDHTGRSVTYHYDVSTGDLTSVDDVLDQTWTYEYDPSLFLLTRVAAPGDVTIERTEYYPDGRAWKQFDGEDNLIVELIYNADGTTTIKDSPDDTNHETHAYDERGTLRVNENDDGGQQEKHYDFNFRPDLITDPLGNPTVMEWSDNGTSLEYIKDALDGETSIYYEDPENPNGPTRIVDPMQYETKYFYADSNFPTLPTRIEYPLSFDGGVTWIGTDYEYYLPSSGAAAGKVKLVTDALGNQTFYTYDSSGQTETVTTAYGTPDALTTTYTYDPLGRLTEVTDEQDIVTNNEFDASGRLTKTIRNVHPIVTTQNYQDKYNIVTEYRYDLRGNQIAVIDTYGTITRTYFDLADRPVTVVQNLFVNGTEDDINTPIGNIPVYNPDFPDHNIRMDTEYDDAGNVIVTRDPAGIITRTYYDEANRPKLVIQNWAGTDLYGDISTAPSYNPAYPDQNVRIEYFYDANSNVIGIKDTLDVVTRTYYDVLNRPATVVQNLTGQDIGVETPPARGSSSNIRTDSYYDANGNVILIVDPKGILTRTYYDALNRPITVVQNLARTVAEAISNPTPPDAGVEFNIRSDTYYDETGNVIATVDPRTVVTRTYYDSTNRPVTIVNNLVNWDIYLDTPPARGDGLSDENVRTDIAYDQYGRRDTTTDPFGRVTKYEYDEVGRLSEVIGNYINGGVPQNDDDQRNIVTTYTYDALGRQVTTTDTMNRVAWSVYDDLGRVVTTTQNYLEGQPQNYEDSGDRFNIVTTYTYDAGGNQIGVTDTANIKTRTYYDSLGRPITVARNFTGAITDPTPPTRANPPDPKTNLRTDTVYLGDGSVDYVVDELGKTTDYSYDVLGRLTAVLDPLLNPTGYEYDANGSRTLMTDAEGVSTRYEYDGSNRLKAVVENYRPGFAPTHEINVRTEYGYDAGGNRLSILDGNNNPATFTYTAFGQIETETDALGNDYTYEYDSMGNRRSMLDANDALTIFDYDELNRLISIDYPDSDPDVSFEYDALGRRLSMTDGLGTTSWIYTNLDQPRLITDPFSTQVLYGYDEAGNRTLLSYGSQEYTYQYYDGTNQLKKVISDHASQSVAEYQYDAAGRLKEVARPNGVNTTYNYYDNGWLQDIFHTAGTETLASYQYQYDNVGNRVQAIENVTLPSVTNEAPQFELGSDAVLDEGDQFTRSIPFSDPDSTEWQLTVDYGDGTAPTQTTLYAEGNIELAHAYADDGTYTLSVTLNDNEGGETSDSILVTVANVAPVVNAGADQSADINDTVMVNASYTDAGTLDTHTATIDWGDGNSGPVNVTPTGAGTGTVSEQHAYASTGNFTVEVCVTDSDNGTGCDTILVEVDSSGTGTTEIRIGETYVTPIDDYGNGNLLVAQHTTLSQEATLQSLSFYVTQAAGNLRLGIYDDANGNPGALVAKTDEFTPVVGWNTQSVQTPVVLPPGSYWLAYLPESNDLHFRYGWPGEGQETGRYYSYTYGEMPATFSSSAWSGEFQFSFYATFTVAVEPGTMYVGEVNVLHADADESGNLLIAQEAQLLQNASLQSLSFYVTNAVGKLRLGIYDNGWDGPGTLMAQTDEFTPVVGWNTVSVQTPMLLPAGTYWLAFLPESDDLGFKYEWLQGQYTGRIYGYPYGEMPSLITDPPMGVEYRFSLYATFIEDESVYSPATAILDDFHRADGAIGSNWSGVVSAFEVSSNQLEANTNSSDSYIFWGNESFGPDQEAYVTISQVNTDNWYLSMLLKSQSNATYEDGLIEVYYQANTDLLQVWSLDPNSGWTQYGADIPLELGNGDRLAARTFADGRLELYKNETLFAARNLAGWAYSSDGGYIGLWFANAASQRLDDFGGGTLPGGEMMMASTFGAFEAETQPEGSVEFTILSSQFNPAVDLDSALLQAASTASGQRAYVTIAKKNAGEIVLDRSQRDRSQKDGEIQVLFDMAGRRIQILKYDSQKGWAQVGKDISVRFKDGERFRLSLRVDGTLEIYRNGKLLEKRDVTVQSSQLVSTRLSRRSYRVSENRSPNLATPKMADVFFTEYVMQAQSYSVTINYDYDDLYRLTAADYSTGDYYHYDYDAVGNRLSQETYISGQSSVTSYQYDDASRLTSVNGVSYTWDNNGNLLNDGANLYTYDSANRLKTISGATSATFSYSGMGDRLTQNGVNYTLDLNTGLTQVLDDGANAYVYGNGRIAQANGTTTEYFLGDALGSVRQLTDASGNITLAKSYDPYGTVSQSIGNGESIYAFTGEQQDASGLTYLRARYYASGDGRFISRDTWGGDYSRPMSLNRWNYGLSNPANFVDPSGNIPRYPYPDPPLTNPGYARRIQQNLYLLGDPSKAPGWDNFIKKYRTAWNNSGKTIWWLNLLCQDEPLYDMKEIVIAIDMAKEFSGVHYDEARQVWSEAVGRRYWHNCTSFSCFVMPDWTASNAFLNFLSYDESIRKMTMTDYSLIFMTEGIRNSTLNVAKNITRNGLGMGGKLDNRPYDYFCTNCSGIKSPPWLTSWLAQVVKNSPKSLGMKSYSGEGEMQVAFAAGRSDIFTVILTPRQKMDLCGQSNCFDPALKKPEWMK